MHRFRFTAIFVLALMCSYTDIVTAQEKSYRVLVIQSFRASIPAAADWHRGITRGLTTDSSILIEVDIESPDLSRISDATYLDIKEQLPLIF
jgi:hypothetical protein